MRLLRVLGLSAGLLGLVPGCFSRGGLSSDPDGADLGGEEVGLDFTGLTDEDLQAAADGGKDPERDMARGTADLGTPSDLRPPPDLRPLARPPCLQGTGFAAFRFHYEPGSTSARLDAFGLPDSSNWEAVPVRPTMVVDVANGGGLNIASGNWILIRFSLNGITRIGGATLSMRGRSYSVGTSGSFEAWSPLYGSISSPPNSVSNAWPYRWTSVDYSANVRVGDPPGLTGIRFYAGPNSNNLVVNTVELCIDGD